MVFVTSIFGNSCFLAAIHKNIALRTPINILLCNAAVSDVMFTILSLAQVVEFVMGEWYLTDAVCRIQGTFIELSYTVSITTLTAISVIKFLIISRNEASRIRWVNGASNPYMKLSVVIWISSIILCSPLFVLWKVSLNKEGKNALW